MSELRIGMVGLDTSHCEAFTEVLHNRDNPHFVEGGRIVGAYPGGSDLCAVSRDRVAKFTEAMRDKRGVKIYDSIESLGEQVDAWLLESVDGRQHLEQFSLMAPFGKPVFIDKPLACSYEEARQIAELADRHGAPIMSASSLRFSAGVTGLAGEDEEVRSCEAFGTMAILDDYPAYFWYAVHGAEIVFSYLGRGCRTVQALHRDDADLLIGLWEDGRIGTVRALRFAPYHFGCTVFTTKGTRHSLAQDEPPAYSLMMKKVLEFFRTGVSPVDVEETLQIMAFLDAAGQSLEKGGQQVALPG